ncbi:serine/threonine-protein phosphatase [Rhodococcus sp. BP-149]|uniref:PP2C family protein-serine/threonine phosphatase n=1 Tax=unclassified Rhodococcus (in: high G+C Gram-positive bacteria) TaxID=192944 RepID=UPI001C9B3370|nr:MULTISPECIES: PP2C family serine/threonine-protein phosphatase [unclassified Rhodococcus (in: high G+C Gram-positive bacteria)]MBY6687828.1 serine/threonine-protein phosphatase [Rhodococcus sp. BP-288]MBY6696233.1 serine/threonine-protein phosphatase [Rhodococcus sp. BP-188]MBY6700761.1 serine/threonine-protein phosphatase [Rhodococcus sp. BP-285]MBY6701648.1 serine/threonine-protein phosphatase [Rhodococcus sp. BP-283]MBY6712649.1 serine/threonine-protein phosphatase [Rhodococcus sp. BP-16
MTLVLRYAARSDRGLVRSNNEDSVYAGARLLALADGMGGHAAGEVASQLMIAALAHLDDDEPGDDLLGKLERATREGNSTIAEQVEEDPELDGMGTTLTAILFGGRKIGLVHIGDSRAYLLRDDELTQITRDDTFVQSLVDEGRITAEQAHSHPQRSLIMRALTGNEIEPTLTVREARAGDRYLLCSDGLSDVVSSETIADTLREGENDECADRLIELALRSGGPDNVTVVVADVIDLDYGQSHPILAGAASMSDEEDAPPPNTAAGRAAAMRPPRTTPKRVVTPPPVPEKKSHKLRWSLAGLGVVALLVVGLVVGWQLLQRNYYVGTDDGRVVVMRGVSGSVLGFSLQEVDLVGCVRDGATATEDATVELRAPGDADCTILGVDDLQPSAREQVRSGLPSGTLDDARTQVARLASGDLLPPCTPPASTTTTPSATPEATPAPTAAPPAPDPAVPVDPAAPVTTTIEPTPAPTPTLVAGQTCRTGS